MVRIFGAAAAAALVSSHALAAPSVDDARAAVQEAIKAAADARQAASVAEAAAQRAQNAVAAAQARLAVLDGAPPPSHATGPAKLPTDQPTKHCPNTADMATVQYVDQAKHCENRIHAGWTVADSDARDATGIGTTVEAAGSGSTASLDLEHTMRGRTHRHFDGATGVFTYQRITLDTIGLAVRANIDKDDKSQSTIATFGDRSKLAGGVAVTLSYGRSYTRSEPAAAVQARAAPVEQKLSAQCLASGNGACHGLDLIRWIFDTKVDAAGGEAEFANPDAVKLYDSVFWGAAPSNPIPRFGWSFRGEISRPEFNYYPFALTQIADPFNPGSTKTAIDPARFPSDFAAHLVDEHRIDWSLGARAFFHVGAVRGRGPAWTSLNGLSPLFAHNTGFTFIASASYVRADEIDQKFRDIQICPSAGNAMEETDAVCTTTSIAAPRRTQGVVLGGEVRQGISSLWIMPPALLSASVTHNFGTGESGLVVPLYFQDKKGAFSGGLRFGHQWGGRNIDGTPKKAESLFGIVLGTSVTLDGSTGAN